MYINMHTRKMPRLPARFCLRTSALFALLALVVMACNLAQAHGINVVCKGSAEIRCKGAFSDGKSLHGAGVRVLNYKDVVVWTGKVDASGQVAFQRPKEKFYVQFIGADNHMVELDHAVIKP